MRDFYPNGSSPWTPLSCYPAVLAACTSPGEVHLPGPSCVVPTAVCLGRARAGQGADPQPMLPQWWWKTLACGTFRDCGEGTAPCPQAPGIQQGSSRELVLAWTLQEHCRYVPWKEVFKAVDICCTNAVLHQKLRESFVRSQDPLRLVSLTPQLAGHNHGWLK